MANVAARKEPLLPATVQAELETLACKDITASPIGQIVDYWETPTGNWWITFTLDATEYEGEWNCVCYMIVLYTYSVSGVFFLL